MATFFDEQYLGTYLNDRSKDLLGKIDLEGRIKKIVDDPSTEELMAAKLQEMALPQRAHSSHGTNDDARHDNALHSCIDETALAGFATEMATKMKDSFDITEFVSVDSVRDEIDALMTEKLQELTPPIVKKLMEDVIREHLGWLIIWGNIFGGALGRSVKPWATVFKNLFLRTQLYIRNFSLKLCACVFFYNIYYTYIFHFFSYVF